MSHTASLSAERKIVTAAAAGLVMRSINRKARIMAIQQSADTTVPDKEHIARFFPSQDVFDLAYDAQLGINRALPAPNADLGLRKN